MKIKSEKNKVLKNEVLTNKIISIKMLLFIILICLSCNNGNMTSHTNKEKELEVEIIPSGGGVKGYKIEITDNILISSTHELVLNKNKLSLGKEKSVSKTDLSKSQMIQIHNLLKKIDSLNEENRKTTSFKLDTWNVVISKENNILVITDSTIMEDSASPIGKLLKILIEISPNPIKLDTQS